MAVKDDHPAEEFKLTVAKLGSFGLPASLLLLPVALITPVYLLCNRNQVVEIR